MTKDSFHIMVTWEKVPLHNRIFIPHIPKFGLLKSVQLQSFLIVFNYDGKPSEQIFAFDFEGKQWLKARLVGDELDLRYGSSVCAYDNETIVMFGVSSDGKDDVLNVLSFNKGVNWMHVYNDLTRIQDGLLKSGHSANIIDDQMYIFGGESESVKNDGDLHIVDLSKQSFFIEKIFIGKETLQVKKISLEISPGKLCDHSSVLKDKKIYIYGGVLDKIQNKNIYILNIESLEWKMIEIYSRIHSTFQIYKENIYLFGGVQNDPSSNLSIFNRSENIRYEVKMRETIPPPSVGAFSAIYDEKMLIFGGVIERDGEYNQDFGQIYSFDFEDVIKPVDNFIKQVIWRRDFGFEEDNRDLEALFHVRRLLDENGKPDVVFKVQGIKMDVHKNILSFRSSFFEKMFSSGMKESHSKVINFKDISPQALIALLKYLYNGNFPSQESVLKELIIYTEKILLKKLKGYCERALIDRITKENAAELYEVAKMANAGDLREAALYVMTSHLDYFADQFASLLIK